MGDETKQTFFSLLFSLVSCFFSEMSSAATSAASDFSGITVSEEDLSPLKRSNTHMNKL